MAARWTKRRLTVTFLFIGILGLLYYQSQHDLASSWQAPQQPPAGHGGNSEAAPAEPATPASPAVANDGVFQWSKLKRHHPIPTESMTPVPTAGQAKLQALPRIQHDFKADVPESAPARKERLARLAQVRSNFTHAWGGYKTHAWLADEVRPVTGTPASKFGGWAATLVDALDTLWIMDLRDEFAAAVAAVEQIDFTVTDQGEVNVFETTIRFLGGLLGALDVSGGPKKHPGLLRKAVEVGDMLYAAFDTANHLPVTRWKLTEARKGLPQAPHQTSLVSELGTLSLEFTRLSQLTGDPKYYDAVHRVMDLFSAQQDKTYLPGMWPVVVNAVTGDLTGGSSFTIGGMADSLYEYLPKQFLLLGGAVDMYRDMYLKALAAMETNIFFRARTPAAKPMLFPGDKTVSGKAAKDPPTVPRVQHLGCFAGGMVGLGARLFGRPGDMETATQLVEGCLWGYEAAPAGIMPEIMLVSTCPEPADAHAAPCLWDVGKWHHDVAARRRPVAAAGGDPSAGLDVEALAAAEHLVPGVTKYEDKRYILRPEAIESVFVLYRLTGDRTLQERAWRMFESVVRWSKTELAHTAMNDCTQPDPRGSWSDSMESFWLAETLKYFYLIFAEPDEVSLDTFVLNTEAHPFLRAQE